MTVSITPVRPLRCPHSETFLVRWMSPGPSPHSGPGARNNSQKCARAGDIIHYKAGNSLPLFSVFINILINNIHTLSSFSNLIVHKTQPQLTKHGIAKTLRCSHHRRRPSRSIRRNNTSSPSLHSAGTRFWSVSQRTGDAYAYRTGFRPRQSRGFPGQS